MAIQEMGDEFALTVGKQADRPAPSKGLIYLSEDEKLLNVCFNGNEWIEQAMPVQNPLTVDENGNLLFNGKAIYTPVTTGEEQFLLNSASPFQSSDDAIHVRVTRAGQNNLSVLLSTSPTVAGLSESNILSAGVYMASTMTVFKKVDFITAYNKVYAYRGPATANYEQLLNNLSSFASPNGNSTAVTFVYSKINRVKVI